MILDSSAIIAVIRREQGYEDLVAATEAALDIGVGAPTLAETTIVLTAMLGVSARSILASFLHQNRIVVIPFDDRHWTAAGEAFILYGKGRHPAALNFGDCLTYATARLAGAPLLFVGEDFTKTDLPNALTDGPAAA